MDLSPNDIRNYKFPNQMRGYDKEEVDNLLEQVAVALEEARQQNLKFSMEVEALKTQLTALKEFEDTIKNAAIDARRNADATVTAAKKEAEKMLEQAKADAEKVIAANEVKIAAIKERMNKLDQTKRSYISQLRTLMNSHIEMVDEIATEDIKKDIHGEEDSVPVTDSREDSLSDSSDNIEVTESEDVTRQRVETLSDVPEEKASEADDTDTEGEEDAIEKPQVAEEKPKTVDPELVAALEKYKQTHEEKAKTLNPEDFGPAPPQGSIVETDKRAEDIPPGFIAKVANTAKSAQPVKAKPSGDGAEDSDNAADQESDGLAPDAQDAPTEHNAIDMDRESEEEKAKSRVSPDELAKALDGVVSKFEEEMDKAEKR